MSGNEKQTVGVRDLAEEAKKRIVLLVVCVVGMSYLMSLTSASVLVNLPAALSLIIIMRYMSLDFDMRRKAATYKGKQISANSSSENKPFEVLRVLPERSDWKHKVNSPIVEDAINKFNSHIVSEWVTGLWYSRITPDRQATEELVLIMNGVLGEISSRMRNINLIDLLTRDIINIVSTRLELFRESKIKIEKHQERYFTTEELDIELKSILAAENKLHPILFSAEAEHKVLQHVMDGLIVLTFNPEDLKCSLFRYIVRELLACVVIRPVLNLANPRFINERIESAVISSRKTDKESKAAQTASQSRINAVILPEHTLQFPDPSVKGVELVQLKQDQNNKAAKNQAPDNMNAKLLSKDPLLSMDTRSTRSWSSLPDGDSGEGRGVQRHPSGGEWGDALDVFSRRKTEALAPEHFDNMWTKGRDYKRKEDINQLVDPSPRSSSAGLSNSGVRSKVLSEQKKKERTSTYQGTGEQNTAMYGNLSNESCSDEVDSWSSSYTEDDDTSSAMGLDSPGVKVWDGKNKRNFSHIHHPLETFDRRSGRKTSKGQFHSRRLQKTKSAKKRSRSSTQNGHVWQEVERTTLLGDGQDLLKSSKETHKPGDSSEESETELLGRICSGATTSSSMSLASFPESQSLAASSAKNSIIADSFFQLRCEVLGANIVKSGSKTFAVYCISVIDVNSHSWSIKRRYQHFEELHRRLKEFPEYNLHLPPKHFLSTGLDVFVIQERCKLLDQYLKKLLQLPTVSGSIEVWDFLSVDSQMYIFSDSLSIIDTLPVYLDETVRKKNKENQDNVRPVYDPLSSRKENSSSVYDGSGLRANQALSSPRRPEKEFKKASENSNSGSDNTEQKNIKPSRNLEKTGNRDQQESHSVPSDNAPDSAIPREWVPPNLSVPILDLVDVILQLKDGGWIRRKAFWVAKQVLQLGMGDAFDDWLIEKIQVLRRGSVVASGIGRLEQILWPDGIFITKHPRRQRPSPDSPPKNLHEGKPSTPSSPPKVEDALKLEEMQKKEAERRAKFVYELMIDKAPAAIVGLVGHKEYEQCAKDLYYFIQSSVFMKQLAFDILQLLLSSAFPELDSVFRQLEQDKHKFGSLKRN
ncbi:hypothetical protein ABFS82_09G110900 [Erythranthe guttata]|uniref:uncharacterized protein LOC105975759 n=1 Tax=Erythranthe guttata TaxID=4155 RepID=UPI00064DAC26|nr:PREDICTED: uncharacterized protein LOC105975759 [Erythranthe guttata]|eukprot:XP_012856440.1 PREDICTED: uncharacterized protein LOC105975759 [Erythranthe guttata]